jgi:MraZ protein
VNAVLRGNYTAKIDDKGRLKVPSAFRALIEQAHGPQLQFFVTSLSGEFVLVYPMSVWEETERRLAEIPSTLPARTRYLDRVNYFGQVAELDKQGRVLIHQRLRESADITGEVDVFGHQNHLKVWNHDRFIAAKLQGEPLTEQDFEILAKYGV